MAMKDGADIASSLRWLVVFDAALEDDDGVLLPVSHLHCLRPYSSTLLASWGYGCTLPLRTFLCGYLMDGGATMLHPALTAGVLFDAWRVAGVVS